MRLAADIFYGVIFISLIWVSRMLGYYDEFDHAPFDAEEIERWQLGAGTNEEAV